MLSEYWDQVRDWFKEQGLKMKSHEVLDLAAQFLIIKPEIKDYVLLRILAQNQKLSSIACYRARQIEKADLCDSEEIDLQIFKL